MMIMKMKIEKIQRRTGLRENIIFEVQKAASEEGGYGDEDADEVVTCETETETARERRKRVQSLSNRI